MGIVGVTVAIAACFMGLRMNFDPTSGPSRLLIAFEVRRAGRSRQPARHPAGRHRARHRPDVGGSDRRRVAGAGRPPRLPCHLPAAPQGLLPRYQEPALRTQRPLSIVSGRAILAVAAIALAAAPLFLDAGGLTVLTEFPCLLVLGTVLFFLLREYLAQLGTWHLIILGTLSIAIILIEPRGLWGLLRRLLGGDLIPVSHRARPGCGTERKP